MTTLSSLVEGQYSTSGVGFGAIDVPGQPSIIADESGTILQLVAGDNITLTVDPELKRIVIAGQAAGIEGETDTLQAVTDRGSTTDQTVSISNTTESTDLLTGALTVSGGIAITKNVNIGGILELIANTGNNLRFTSAAAGSSPAITALGADTDIGISITPKGTGKLTVANGLVVTGTLEHQGLTFTTGTDIDQVTTYTKSLTLTTEWQDTGIKYTDLDTGTYIVQMYANDAGAGGDNVNEYYSGTMTWWAGNTQSSAELPTDEIVLHRAGGSGDGGMYLRTFRTNSPDTDRLKLQIYSNTANPSASNYVFKFRRVL
jgi:hypothetical protein